MQIKRQHLRRPCRAGHTSTHSEYSEADAVLFDEHIGCARRAMASHSRRDHLWNFEFADRGHPCFRCQTAPVFTYCSILAHAGRQAAPRAADARIVKLRLRINASSRLHAALVAHVCPNFACPHSSGHSTFAQLNSATNTAVQVLLSANAACTPSALSQTAKRVANRSAAL